MRASDYLDHLIEAPANPEDELRRIDAMTGDERDELRRAVVLRLADGTLPPNVAVAVLPIIGVEPAVPDLVRLLRSAAAPVEARAAALILLQFATYDLAAGLETFDVESLAEVIQAAAEMRAAADVALQMDTPFERLTLADPDDEEAGIEEIVEELIAAFCDSAEAAAAQDAEELRFWAGQLVLLGVQYGYGTPVLWAPDDLDEILSDLLPRKLTIESADDAKEAVPAFRAFFRWAARVAVVPDAEAIEQVLDELEPEFPAMMMDESRFGPAKAFVVRGMAAGYDMSTEEGLHAFQEQWNREHALPAAASRKKADAAKKRKAKMAKMSRRKNRRRK